MDSSERSSDEEAALVHSIDEEIARRTLAMRHGQYVFSAVWAMSLLGLFAVYRFDWIPSRLLKLILGILSIPYVIGGLYWMLYIQFFMGNLIRREVCVRFDIACVSCGKTPNASSLRDWIARRRCGKCGEPLRRFV